VVGLLGVGVAAPPARAEDDDGKRACAAAYEQTQTLRLAGRLSAARERAAACAQASCAEFIRADCGAWAAELAASQPSVVLAARDAAGRAATAVRVELDGAPWLDAIDDQPKPIDPGHHALRFSLASGTSIEEQVDVREGDRGKKLTVSFPRSPPLAMLRPPPASTRRGLARSITDGASAGLWALGGLGVVSLAAGAALGGIALHDDNVIRAQCSKAGGACTPQGDSATQQGRALGPASTASLVLGGAAVLVATVGLVARWRTAAPLQAVQMGAVASSAGSGFTLAATW
jgi:hypothetical protein